MFQFHLETKAITEEKYFLRSLFNFCFLLTEQIFNCSLRGKLKS